MPRLRHCYPDERGIRRRRQGSSFVYLSDGERVDEAATLDRIAALAIPPAWRDVWVCPYANGHIQAAGTDAAGRRQYLYHEHWRERRDGEKFDRMLAFAAALPAIRSRVADDLAGRVDSAADLSRRRVLACAIRLLDRGFFRVGGETYAEENGTFGLATLLRSQATLAGDDTVVFDYVAKSHKERSQAIADPQVYRIVARLKRRRDGRDELLAWRGGGVWHDVRSQDINDYLKEITGGDYSAKDFRTWHATVLAAVGLAVSTRARRTDAASRRAVVRVVREVAHYLGNTPAIARSAYIDPRVIDRYRAGRTIASALDALADGDPTVGSDQMAGGDPTADHERRQSIEAAVVVLIRPQRVGARKKDTVAPAHG